MLADGGGFLLLANRFDSKQGAQTYERRFFQCSTIFPTFVKQ